MNTENQSSRGVLKNKFNLGLNTKRLVQVSAKLPLTTTETELVFIIIDGVSELTHQLP